MSDIKANILIVEDEKNMREVLGMLLEAEGYVVAMAEDGAVGLQKLEDDIYDLIITDIKMPGATGFEILKRSLEVSPDTLIIMITAFGTVESGIEAMKLGAYDYINKPFKIDEIRHIVRNAIDKRKLKEEVDVLRENVRASFKVDNIIGKSAKMQKTINLLPKVAKSNSNVLITGESGTGKELIASAIHNLSNRSQNNFVAINCAALPEGLLESEIFGHMKGSFTGAVQNKQGLFEIADNGTLFLDEIGDMPMNLQSKLLRAIEYSTFRRVGGTTDITVNCRILAATNKELKKEVENSRFREDLYFRLNVIPVHIPPLRERKDDIPVLLDHFVRKYSKDTRQISGSALNLLMQYPWYGNVRELENIIERVLLFAETEIITDADLPEEITAPIRDSAPGIAVGNGVELEVILEDMEKKYLQTALRHSGGNKTEAAKLLGLTFRSFRHKLSKYDIKGS